MERTDVYAAIDTERDFQEAIEKKWIKDGTSVFRGPPTVERELLIMQHYVRLAREAYVVRQDNKETLSNMRKIAAVLVRCFENHGVESREVTTIPEDCNIRYPIHG